MSEPRRAKARGISELALFFSLSFLITWAICGIYLVAPKAAFAAFGPMKTGSAIFFAAVYAPSFCAIALTVVREGPAGLIELGASAIRIRGRWWWILAALIGYPSLWLIVSLIQALAVGSTLASVPYSNWYAALPTVILSGFIFRDAGPLGEELGWRGYSLPRLLDIMAPRKAALLLGAIWAIWHVPAFFLAGLSQSKFQFGSFFFEVVGFSVFMTLLFIHTRGSVLLSGIIPHMWFNAVSKAGIHPVAWITIALAAALLLFGRRLWYVSDLSMAELTRSNHNKNGTRNEY